ncbi:programmed cell death protein 2-like [Centruroides vittatus]|uniref:programmed cell death protein 2-like n=1 Tax=Centruroides vittatus TaxID=120091 RepID=UPI003510719D
MSQNQVLLGIKDAEVQNDNETNWSTNKIGGKPNWMPTCSNFPNLKCKLCGQKMILVVQLYCPLGNSLYHRTLYVFCCIDRSCWNKQESWQVYRNQFPVVEKECNKVETVEIQNQPWLSDELDWEEEEECKASDDSELLYVTEEIANLQTEDKINYKNVLNCDDVNKLNIIRERKDSMPTELIPAECDLKFKSYYVNVIEEPDDAEMNKDVHIQRLLSSYHMHEGSEILDSGCSGVEKETYEKDWVRHGDELFYRFAKRVARCQNQIIRYCWSDQPLLISKMDHVSASCKHCKGPLVFEFQLMPALVEMLKMQEFNGTAVEFGTVIVMTCQQSCWDNDTSFCTELVYVQSDPDESLFVNRNSLDVIK